MEKLCNVTKEIDNIMYYNVLYKNSYRKFPRITREEALEIEEGGNLEILIALLNSTFEGCSYLIPKIIGKIGKNYTQLLLKVAKDERIKLKIRRFAIEGIGKIGNSTLLTDLNELISDKNIYIRKSVILAHAFIKDKRSVDILLNILEREVEWIKKDIIWALGIIGDNRVVSILIHMLKNRNLKFMTKKNIVIALGNIGDRRAVETLIQIVNDDYSGLQEHAFYALGKMRDKRTLNLLIKKYLDSFWFLKEHYKNLLNKISLHWSYLLKNYEYKVYRKEELSPIIFDNFDDTYQWHYGYLNKSHYILNRFNKIVGCLNLVFLSIYQGTYLFYWDTIEIKKNYRRRRFGSNLTKFMIKNELEKYKNYIVFLLVANCEQYKLKFFSTFGFLPVKLRNTKVGTHCIMCYPYKENSEELCQKLFEYFNWREEKREVIASDCKFAFNPNPTGLYWCEMKKIYVTGIEKQNCKYYIKEKELFNEKKILDLTGIINSNLEIRG